ncbi:class I SAM-dependent methyltransferase [Photobacterium sagamiensis]|uniref:class I SAM-dependent methyltransferase n=1 Tax=Photobacterium sagamiensis TaxID=2910241 RepID=UPI003D09E0AA
MLKVKSAQYCGMAGIYSTVTKVISMGGNSRSQEYFLKLISPEIKILNTGCGSICFSEKIASKNNNVTSVDISPRMIEEAKKNFSNRELLNNITFVCEDILKYEPNEKFDIVFVNFFLNTFNENDYKIVLLHLLSMVKEGGLLCIADEVTGTKLSTKIEQIIFRPIITRLHGILAKHPLHPIYDYTPFITENGFSLIDKKRDKTDYICSFVYQK